MRIPNRRGTGVGHATHSGAIQFSANVVYVSLVAAIAAAVAVALSLDIWAMFIGWTCFGTGTGSIKKGSAAIGCLLIGLILGMGSILALGPMESLMGFFALPAVVFLLAAIAMLSLLTRPLNSVPGYFLGMTAYYASRLNPGAAAFVHLGSASVIGAVGGCLLIAGPKLIERKSAYDRKG